MLVKGIIIDQVNQILDNNYTILNRYNVRIPVFEAQGSNDKAIIECGLIFQPGTIPAYKSGDIVVVGFEQNNINSGIILGELFTEEAINNTKIELTPATIKVENTAVLPKDTTINGLNIFNEIVDIKNKIAGLTPAEE